MNPLRGEEFREDLASCAALTLGIADNGSGYSYRKPCDQCLRITKIISVILVFLSLWAIIIIGILGATQTLSSATMGWTLLGLGSGILVANLLIGIESRKWVLLTFSAFAATFITLGALGGAGILSASQVGIGTLSTFPAAIPLFAMTGCCLGREENQKRFLRR